MLTVGSLFAGIGGFDLGFERAGFRVVWQVENDGKAQSVLSLRFPNAALHNDVRTANGLERVDVITGGFPCQDLSVAGRRGGLAGARSGLFWQIVRIARELNPRWMVLENVPGLLSSHGGRDFHAVLVALAECGFRRAYRILDSRYFGVPQRRRRVFLVLRARGLGDGPGAVLFEPESSYGDSQTSAAARPDVAPTLESGINRTGGTRPPGTSVDTAETLQVVGPLGGGNDGIGRRSEDDPNLVYGVHANQRGELRTSALAGSLNGSRSGKQYEGVYQCHGSNVGEVGTLRSGNGGVTGGVPFLAATLNSGGNDGGFRTEPGEHLVSFALRRDPGGIGQGHNTTYPGGVRRLTPLECERLQSFPDGWTCLCGKGHLGSSFCTCSDSPRYRQLGNAVTVSVAEWIARRIAAVEI